MTALQDAPEIRKLRDLREQKARQEGALTKTNRDYREQLELCVYTRGWRQTDIAAELGISRQAIRQSLARKEPKCSDG